MTTHVGLTARAFGVDVMYLSKMDKKIQDTINDVVKRFGGDFIIEEAEDWRKLVREWDGDVIHLTMYGENIDNFANEADFKDPLVILGAEKVPSDVYDLSNFNIAVGSQPHSEVAALAVFLDRLNKRKIPSPCGGKLKIIPSKKSKIVINRESIPGIVQCYRLMKEQKMEEEIIIHSLSVLDRTLELHEIWGGDIKLLTAGALLHDIGRTVTHDVRHGIEGGKIIREKGWDDEVARIVERHIGGGITKEEARKIGLPSRSYIPETLEEKIVCHADNTAGGNERFIELVQRIKAEGYDDSVKRMRNLAKEFKYDFEY
ncbi:MAG: HD domain-containing protein [Thermoplasmatota archaeon]